MNKMLLLLLAFAALSGAKLPDRQISRDWQIEVRASGGLEFRLHIERNPSRGATLHAFRLQILEGSPSERSILLFQIGDRPYA
jgi:hypothetical protein